MAGVLNGFAVIVAVVALGWLLARTDVLGDGARLSLNRLVFFVATPALLFDSLARTSLDQVFNAIFAVSAGTAVVIAVVYVVLARVWVRAPAGDLMVGALAAGYVNSANLGIPIALYVLGDLGFVFPLLLFQVVIMQPVAIAVLERAALTDRRAAAGGGDGGRGPDAAPRRAPGGAGRAILAALRTPIVVAALLGIVVAATPWTPPDQLLEPVRLIGQISVPGALLVFGMSLYGVRVLEKGVSPRREIALATVLKTVAHPLLAYAVGAWVMGMSGHMLFTVVVAAALPTAQNVLIVATTYGRGMLVARDTAVLTTLAALPVLLLVSALLA